MDAIGRGDDPPFIAVSPNARAGTVSQTSYDTSVPSRPAGVSSTPFPCPGMASRGTLERSARCLKNPRYGMYSPNGTRWTFSKRATRAPVEENARISLRKLWVDTVSVTPTTSVACIRTASAARFFSAGVPSMRLSIVR